MPDNNPEDLERTVVTGEAVKGVREPRVGDLVGSQYRLLSILGRGGMGVVYLAEHITIGRQYALKTLLAERVDEVNARRFKIEGRAIARLEHRNIVKVYDMGIDAGGCLYYVMDRLDGVSLAEKINRRNLLPLPTVLNIFTQLCSGLGYAHKQRLVHRDVKPTNIILCRGDGPAGQDIMANPLVKIIDYGLVKEVGDDPLSRQTMTSAGQVCGSPLYMSPEQCMGNKVDERSDIYSLGCALYECLTGEPPFTGKTGLDTAFMHQTYRLPSLAEARPEMRYPRGLEQVVAGMLEKSAANRYQTMEQVAQDLDRVKKGQPVHRTSKSGTSGEDDGGRGAKKTVRSSFTNLVAATVRRGNSDDGESFLERFPPPVLAGAAVILLACGVAAWALSVSFFGHRGADSSLIATGLVESPETEHARDVFNNCPQISNGLVDDNGAERRVFKFPDISLGTLCWGDKNRVDARGLVIVPPNEQITLLLEAPAGQYTRAFPRVLSKIGPDDIQGLDFIDPVSHNQDKVIVSEVPPEIIEIVGAWRALHRLSFIHSTLRARAIKALDGLANVDELRLRDSNFDGKALAKLKWLRKVRLLDLKSCRSVDDVLVNLSGSSELREINLDATSPSSADLAALSYCDNLEIFSMEDCDIDAAKALNLSKLHNVRHLNLRSCIFAPGTLRLLGTLNKLEDINLTFAGLSQQDLIDFHKILPRCRIKYRPFDSGGI